MLPFHPLPGANKDDLINWLLQLQPLSQWHPLNFRLKEVYNTPFPKGYLLPTFTRGTRTLEISKEIPTSVWNNDEQWNSPLEAVSLDFRKSHLIGTVPPWVVIPTCAITEKQFLEGQLTHWHNSEFLRNDFIYELRRQQPFWDLVLDNENDVSVRLIANDGDDEGGIVLVNIIHLKGVPKSSKQPKILRTRCKLGPLGTAPRTILILRSERQWVKRCKSHWYPKHPK